PSQRRMQGRSVGGLGTGAFHSLSLQLLRPDRSETGDQFNFMLARDCCVLRVVVGIMNLSIDDVRGYPDLAQTREQLATESRRQALAAVAAGIARGAPLVV